MSIHKKSMVHALQCLENKSVEDRNFYSTFFTMSPRDAAKLSEKLRDIALTLSESQDDPALGHEVFAMGTFLVPLTYPLDATT